VFYSDSLFNEENTQKLVQSRMEYEFNKKETQIKADQKVKDLGMAEEIRRKSAERNVFIGGFVLMVLVSVIFFFQRNRIRKERNRSDELLLNILPAETAEELKNTGAASARSFEEVTVMFTDFKNFTKASELLSAQELVKEINYCYSEFDKIITHFGIEKIKTIGDSYMCAGGLPSVNPSHHEAVVNAAIEIRDFINNYKKEKELRSEIAFEIRIGIHTGPVVAGIVGIKKFAYDIWGDTVNIASRMESSGAAGKVNISESTYLKVKNKFAFTGRGKIEAKNKGMIDMYFVERAETAEPAV